ncbi:MAG: peptidase T [Treponema sp.]|jgi:tripeptide aminopeptidase|nr:peptidase T [Treponema sp.]
MDNRVREIDEKTIEALIVDRFMRYVRFGTTSDRHAEETPSTPGQWELARALVEELRGLGIGDAELTEHCYVIARLPGSPGREGLPPVGFLAHLDTASDVPGDGVEPALVRGYDGKPIVLRDGVVLDPAEDGDLMAQKGKDLIHADGRTLLGGDDKAGIACLMGALEYLLGHPEISHGPLECVFSPDEETGKGLPDFPMEKIKSAACYTLDGGRQGELEAECFNAWAAEVSFRGRVIHLGHARGILANAALMAAAFAVMLPRSESPEATDGYYGYYCPMDIRGNQEEASLEILLRDFEGPGMERRIVALETFARAVEAQFPGGTVTVAAKPQYYNMKEKIDARPEVLEKLRRAALNLGIDCRFKPIRGGTDGSRLTELGIPTPNIFTGGRNFHSRREWAAVNEMGAACKMVLELARLWGEGTA